MRTITQRSFAARLGNAEKLHAILTTLGDYAPEDNDLTAAGLATLIETLRTAEEHHTLKLKAFSEAVRVRHDFFETATDSLGKKATRIRFYVKARFANEPEILAAANRFALKTRGQKPARYTTETGEKTISRTEKSFGAQLVYLTDMTTFLKDLGSRYNPPDAALQLSTLNDLRDNIRDANNGVTVAHAGFRSTVTGRHDAFAELGNRAQRIKDLIRAQYGNHSDVYNLVKDFQFRA